MSFDSLHACIALAPFSVYLILLGLMNLSRRPLVTTGARDTAALGIGLSGFMVVGPMELFLPEAAALRFGWAVWLLLLAFYGLCLSLLVLLMRPRLVIYNVAADQLRPILSGVVAELDSGARWAGDSLILPNLGVQLHVEPVGSMRNAELVAAGPQQSFNGWRRLEAELATALRKSKTSPNRYGAILVATGLLLIAVITYWTVNDPQTVAQLRDMLRL